MNEYEKQANEFLTSTGTEISMKFKRNGKHFDSDESNRDIYSVTIKRGRRSFSFDFGQSVVNSSGFEDKATGRKYTTDGKSAGGHSYRVDNLKFLQQHGKPVKGTPPTNYSILACLTKYDPGTFENFCSEFGYNTDSKTAEKTYNAVKNEFQNVCALFTDSEIEQLAEIN